MSNPEDEDLLKIEKFLDENAIAVVYTTCDENYLDIVEDKIVINQKQSKKAIIYTLLHEVGHYFCDFYPEEQTPTTQVIEEVLAWDCGYDIGCSLGILIDDEAWQSLMIESISGYIQKANI